MKPRSLLSLAVLGVALLVACDDSAEPQAVAGVYTLATVDGSPPPFLVIDLGAAGRIEGLSGELTLREDMTYRSTARLAVIGPTGARPDSAAVTGRWQVQGRTITLNGDQSGAVLSGTWEDGVVSVTEGGRLFVYRK